ncbi:MAG: mRNA interferase YafQ [Planctomycetota bacterium]
MLQIREGSRFRRDVKRLQRRDKDIGKLRAVIIELTNERFLDERYREHPLTGDWVNYRDCHIEPDWLLLYRITDNELQLARTGSHSDLFK